MLEALAMQPPQNKIERNINILIVDDHEMILHGLTVLLEAQDSFKVVGKASTGRLAIEMCQSLEPDVVLLDMVMPELDGIGTLQELKQKCPTVPIIILTNYVEPNMVQQALDLGVMGYLQKDVNAAQLSEAIRLALAGERTLAPEAVEVLKESTQDDRSIGFDLTAREHDVLKHMVDGRSNGEIAQLLCISPYTVKNHVSNILAKLNATNRVEAVYLAHRNHLISNNH